jgi:hypothetical protein
MANYAESGYMYSWKRSQINGEMKVFKTVIKIWVLTLIVIAIALAHASNPAAANFGNAGIWVFVGLYFLPTIIAAICKHRNSGAIFVLNLFLGWTFLGWVVALVWACTNDPTVTVQSCRS